MKKETAIFAAGCFWGPQYFFDMVPGVLETEVGYTGGYKDNPTYEEVYMHKTGHAESVKIIFDPEKVSYEKLVKHFFSIHNPTTKDAADGINIGDSYRSALYYFDDKQKKIAQKVRDEVQKMYDKPIVTQFAPAGKWWRAENFHQKFTQRTGRGMCHPAYSPSDH